MKSELVPLSDDEYESLMKIMMNWFLIGIGAVLLFIITAVMVNFKLGNRIILGFYMSMTIEEINALAGDIYRGRVLCPQ